MEKKDILNLKDIARLLADNSKDQCEFHPPREDIPYTVDDFAGVAETVEGQLHKILEHAQSWSPKYTYSSLQLNEKAVLVDILLLASANYKQQLWNNSIVVDMSNKILCLRLLTYDLLCSDGLQRETTLMFDTLKSLIKKLSKTNWLLNPSSVCSFQWCLTVLLSPHLSDYLDLVFSPPLLFLDHYHKDNQQIGLQCIHMIVQNTSPSELRMYGRADVYYAAVFRLLYTRDADVVHAAYSCILALVKVVERFDTSKWTKFHEVVQLLLCNMEMENTMPLRLVFIKLLPDFIEMIGVGILAHTKILLRVFEHYLEISNDEIIHFTLKSIEVFISVAWIRSVTFTEHLAQTLLKYLVTKCVNNYDEQSSESCRKCLVMLAQLDSELNVSLLLDNIAGN